MRPSTETSGRSLASARQNGSGDVTVLEVHLAAATRWEFKPSPGGPSGGQRASPGGSPGGAENAAGQASEAGDGGALDSPSATRSSG